MATAIDLGDPKSPAGSIHPRNKQEVGRRLSLAALKIAYQQDIVSSGPVLLNVSTDSKTDKGLTAYSVSIIFDPRTISGNLVFRGTEECSKCCDLSGGVEIFFSDNTWKFATKTTIKDNAVYAEITVPSSINFKAVRFGWQDYPQCGLYNGANIAAPPFMRS